MGSIKDPEDGHAAAKVRTHLIRALLGGAGTLASARV